MKVPVRLSAVGGTLCLTLSLLLIHTQPVLAQDVSEDPGNVADSARVITFGETFEGAIDSVGDVDYFRYEGQAGENLEFFAQNTEGSELDGRLWLYDADSTLIAGNDDFMNRFQSRMRAILPADGPYFIRYAHWLNSGDFPGKRDPGSATLKSDDSSAPETETGGYTLTVRNGDPGEQADSSLVVIYGPYVDDEINPVGDIDFFQFQGAAGDLVEIVAQNNFGSTLDGRLWFYAPDGTLIGESDNWFFADGSTDTTQSFIRTILPADGTYFIRYAHHTNTGDAGKRNLKTPHAERANHSPDTHLPVLKTRPAPTVRPTGTQAETGRYSLNVDLYSASLTAGDGFDGLVPVDWNDTFIWNELIDTTGVAYNVYRSTSVDGPFSLLATVPVSYYPDVSVTNGTTYYYQVSVTSIGTGQESTPRSTVEATPNSDRAYDLNLNLTTTTPVIDGQINPEEWEDALELDISSPYRLLFSPVTMWIKNDAQFLYIAVDYPTGGSANVMGIYFDRDNSDTWDPTLPSGEGNYWVDDFADSVRVLFRPIAGDYPNILFADAQSGVPGVTAGMSSDILMPQFEVAFDLSESNLTAAPGDQVGLHIFVNDGFVTEGIYPPGPPNGTFAVPATFADITLGSEETNPTAIDPSDNPNVAEILEHYPNPFSLSQTGTATLRYGLIQPGPVALHLYDVLGKRITTLVDEDQRAGYHTVTWNGRDANGRRLASGVYVSELRIGERRLVRKLILTQ